MPREIDERRSTRVCTAHCAQLRCALTQAPCATQVVGVKLQFPKLQCITVRTPLHVQAAWAMGATALCSRRELLFWSRVLRRTLVSYGLSVSTGATEAALASLCCQAAPAAPPIERSCTAFVP